VGDKRLAKRAANRTLRDSAACRVGSIVALTDRSAVVITAPGRLRGKSPMMLRIVALIQGFFYLATGVWPLLDIGSFQLVTGPKTDLWLVRTVGVLVSVVGVVLLLGYRSRRLTDELIVLAVGSALGLATIDLVYALSGRISAVYLADAAVELGLASMWGFARLRA
jgi:hypothetical protein